MKKIIVPTIALYALLAVANPALAHTGHSMEGAAAGFLHPFLGLDHLSVMACVGVWAALNPGLRAVVALLGFPVFMLAGALVALAGWGFSTVETVVAVSVVFMGFALRSEDRAASRMVTLLIPLFALSHGYAHGAELSQAASPWLYALGFVSATVVLHGTGYAAGACLYRNGGLRWVRVSGMLTGLFGAWLLWAA